MLGHCAARSQPPTVRGAYGFRLTGLEGLPDGLVVAEPGWPQLRVVRSTPYVDRAPEPPGTMRLDNDSAEVWILGGDRLVVDRKSRIVRLETRAPVSNEALLHPYLALAAALAAQWLGRWVLHGGAFGYSGRAWGLLGDKDAGKSSTLATLLHKGHAVLSDDLLVLNRTELFCGPRCIDLRREAAEALGGKAIGVVGDRLRWRLRPGAVPPSVNLGGLIHLEWGELLAVEPLGPEDRLDRVIRNTYFPPSPGDALALLELAGLPAWRLVRPRRIEALEPATALLLATIG
jgi:hypothetical protein